MSKDEFMINYSECKNFNREIQGNINYLDSAINDIGNCNNHLDGITRYGQNIWNPNDCICDNNATKNILIDNKERYEDFHTRFEKFYTNIKSVDVKNSSLFYHFYYM